jgi:hypothetical protein
MALIIQWSSGRTGVEYWLYPCNWRGQLPPYQSQQWEGTSNASQWGTWLEVKEKRTESVPTQTRASAPTGLIWGIRTSLWDFGSSLWILFISLSATMNSCRWCYEWKITIICILSRETSNVGSSRVDLPATVFPQTRKYQLLLRISIGWRSLIGPVKPSCYQSEVYTP